MTLIRALILVTLGLLFIGCAATVDSDSTPSDEQHRVALAGRVIEGFGAGGDPRVWPGFTMVPGPIVITFPNGHAYACGLDPGPGWVERMIGGMPVLYADKDLWGATDSKTIPALPVNGQLAYAFRLGFDQTPVLSSCLDCPLSALIQAQIRLHLSRAC